MTATEVEMVCVVVTREEWDELRRQVAEIHQTLSQPEPPSPNAPFPGWTRSRARQEKRNA